MSDVHDKRRKIRRTFRRDDVPFVGVESIVRYGTLGQTWRITREWPIADTEVRFEMIEVRPAEIDPEARIAPELPTQLEGPEHGPARGPGQGFVALVEVMLEDGEVLVRTAYVKPASVSAVRVISARSVEAWIAGGEDED